MKRNPAIVFINILVTLLLLAAYHLYAGYVDSSSEQNISEYYQNSTATLVSPHGLRKSMNRGYIDYILVDTRAKEDYERGHITGAINIDSEAGSEGVLSQFKELRDSSDKDILIYCYSASCMNGRKVGALLAKSSIYVKELTVGYNEWEFSPEIWNYPAEIATLNIEDYITRGEGVGEIIRNDEALLKGCSIDNELGC